MSEGSALNVREVLRLIAEQQATLGKLQHLVVEHVLGETRPDSAPGSTQVAHAANDLVVAAASPPIVMQHMPETRTPTAQDDISTTESEPDNPPPGDPTPPGNGAALPDAPAATPPPSDEPPSIPSPTAPMDSPFGDAPPTEAEGSPPGAPVTSVSVAVNSRVGLYLNRPASTPTRRVTNHDLYQLSRLRDVGDIGQLVLQFGEHRGATLFQVAQTDPEYLRSLALTAQRPQVRAAATQLLVALEASQQSPGRRRTPEANSRGNDG
jgi:hypothetical protein